MAHDTQTETWDKRSGKGEGAAMRVPLKRRYKRRIQVEDPRGLEKGEYDGPTDPREKKRKKHNIGGRANLLEEMGRLDAEKMNPNRRAEKHRVVRELNKGYKSGGAVLKGKKVGCQIK